MDSRRPPLLRPVSSEEAGPERAPSAGGGVGVSWLIDRLLAIGRWLLPYVIEPTLWPVTLVVLAHVVAFIAPLMLLAWRDGVGSAWVVLGLSGALSLAGMAAEIRSAHRPGLAWAIIVPTWLASAATAWAAHIYHFF